MGVRPPQNDVDDEPDTVEFGIAALDVYLERSELTFPADADEVVRGLGDPKIDLDPSGNAIPLSRVVDEVDRERFESRRDLLDALHPEFERRRRQTGGSFFDFLRTLLPGS